jgi:hypothetical protein
VRTDAKAEVLGVPLRACGAPLPPPDLEERIRPTLCMVQRLPQLSAFGRGPRGTSYAAAKVFYHAEFQTLPANGRMQQVLAALTFNNTVLAAVQTREVCYPLFPCLRVPGVSQYVPPVAEAPTRGCGGYYQGVKLAGGRATAPACRGPRPWLRCCDAIKSCLFCLSMYLCSDGPGS